jgi:hypothetical protein
VCATHSQAVATTACANLRTCWHSAEARSGQVNCTAGGGGACPANASRMAALMLQLVLAPGTPGSEWQHSWALAKCLCW